MSGMKDIEARLDRSLRNQVPVPKLDASFNAAVWARIAQEETATAPATAIPVRTIHASRWLTLINVLGVTVTLGIALVFALRAFGSIDVPAIDLGVDFSLPTLSEDTVQSTTRALGQVLGYLALAFGLSFTSFGRRIRRAIS